MLFAWHVVMAFYLFVSVILLILSSTTITESARALNKDITSSTSFNRNSFPQGFIFGTGSSAYQYEGAANIDGKGPSIWDTFTHTRPDRILDRSTGDIADDEYHRYKEDIGIIKDMNMDAYRFSISWSRILPKGKLSGGVNKEGIKYYNNVINEVLAKGLKPFVTLFQWDLPQALEDEYGGFLSSNIVADFQEYAEFCFKEFGDRVKHWNTLHEPLAVSQNGYALGWVAPGRCSDWLNLNCAGGDSGTEPYIVSHNQLLAHATAVNIYKTKYQAYQKGSIGIIVSSTWMVPFSDSKADRDATERALDFMLGWFMEPLTRGVYPSSMRSLVGSRLPKFTADQIRLVKGSFDYIGINYYTTSYAVDAPELRGARPNYLTDSLVQKTNERNGVPIGPRASDSSWLYVYPKGIRELLLHIKSKYNNPIIYVTENGMDDVPNDPAQPLEEALNDTMRVDYFYQHISYVQTAIKDGVNVKGYFAWSLLDDFEWTYGYTMRFGINYVDRKNGLKRYPKRSANWLKNFLQRGRPTADSR